MRFFPYLLTTVSCLLSVPVLAQPPSGNSEPGCMVCHSEIKMDFLGSIHAQRGLTCPTCHGGDPADLQMTAMSKSAGFKGKPTRQGTVKLCASCHADPVRMKPYGIPTDQYAQYLTSEHGIRLAKGDTSVAVCTDCHLSHRILPPSDPRSSVARKNVPGTCARCHSDPARMKPYGLSTNQYALYAASVHGVALLDNGNQAAPNCASCHGTHGAIPPEPNQVTEVCGQCHSLSRDAFSKSPHYQVSGRQNLPECVTCHDHHAISKPTLDLFETSCLKCHDDRSDAYKTGEEIKALLISAQTELDDARKEIAQATHRGLNMDREQSSFEFARSALLEVLPIQHTLSLPDVQDYTDRAKSGADDVKLGIHEIFRTQQFRKVVLAFLWIAILVSVATLLLWRRQLIQKRRKMES